MANYIPNTWSSYDNTKTHEENKANGAVITKDRLNHIEEGIASISEELSLINTDNIVNEVLSRIPNGNEVEY